MDNTRGPEGVTPGYDAALALEARASFKAYVDVIGVECIEDIFESAMRNQEQGRRGVTVPGEDYASWITIDDEVSFRVEEYGPFKISMDTALAAIAEIKQEREKQED